MICLLFFTFFRMQEESRFEKVQNNHYNAINWLLQLYKKSNMPENWEDYFANFNLVYLKDPVAERQILEHGESQGKTATPIGTVETIMYGGELYLRISSQSVALMLKSTITGSHGSIVFAFLVAIALFISLYISVFRSLLPLKNLRDEIRKFAVGGIDGIVCKVMEPGSDEIGEVAYEFNRAACKIKELLMSRQLFLRTIMHELKTPIGKGRIISEMLDDELQQPRLIAIFERLNILINEFAKIEQLLSKSYALNYGEYHTSLVIEQARDILLLDDFESKIALDIECDTSLKVDLQLFSLAIKNLLDNALKYASDHKASLVATENFICIKNRGEKLTHPISHYMQAFIREANNKVSGTGLGLYIVDQICLMHKFTFDYAYEDGEHAFYIRFSESNR